MTQLTRTTEHPEIISLQSAYGLPGIIGRNGTVTVASLADLNDWYATFRSGLSLAVGGRYETRADGKLYGLGGLSWHLSWRTLPGIPAGLLVMAQTAEDEVLPDLPVVRAGWPYGVELAQRSAVAL